MEPIVCYITKDIGTPYKLRPVLIDGHQQQVSFNSFRQTITSVSYDESKKYKSYKVYEFFPRIQLAHDKEVAEVTEKKLKVDPIFTYNDIEPIGLYEYYESIGWDNKTKKLNGLTLKKHIRLKMNNHMHLLK